MKLYDRYITIKNYTQTRNESGEVVRSWTMFCHVYARRDKGFGQETVIAGREIGRDSYTYYCRYYPGITRGMRLVDDDNYDIIDVVETIRGVELKIECINELV